MAGGRAHTAPRETPPRRTREDLAPRPLAGRWVGRLLLAATAIAAGYWLLSGPVGGYSGAEVRGYDRQDLPELRAAVEGAVADGTILAVPQSEVRDATADFPWVGDVVVHRAWPRGLIVDVIPARPAAVAVPRTGRPMLVAPSGAVMGPAPKAARLPRLMVAGPALEAGADLPEGSRTVFAFTRAVDPDVAARLRSMRVERGEIVGKLVAGPQLMAGPPERLTAKAAALSAVVHYLSPEDQRAASYIDLSVPERPAAGGAPAPTQNLDLE
jgi:hypothetical protein